MVVGLTGGIGSGKTTVAKMFEALGIPVFYSDKEAKVLMNTSEEIKEQLISLLGQESYSEEGLNRAFVAAKIFNNSALLEAVNAIVHPAVAKHFYHWEQEQQAPYVIQESAIIFENQMEERYAKIIVVTAPEEAKVERVMRRDHVEKEKVEERMKNQLKDEEKLKRADYVIFNDLLEETKNQVLDVHHHLLKIAQ